MTRTVRELAPGVHWTAPEHATDRPTLGAISGEESTLMVDAGASDKHARQFLDALAGKELPPIGTVVLSHCHWDHVFGAAAIDAKLIATQQTSEMVATMATYAWDDASLDQRVAAGLEIAFCRDMIKAELNAEERATLMLRVPDETFETERIVDLGNRTVQLLHVGGDHASDSCIVVVPGVVAFLSDCVYLNIHVEPNRLTRRLLFPLLNRLLALDVDWYVLGHHDAPLTRVEFEAFARALKSAGEAVARQRLDDAALDAQFVRAFQAGRTHEAG